MMTNQLAVDDKVSFLCNGKGRGGHYRVYATVTKINRKTVACTENQGSYLPGTRWIVEKEKLIKDF